MSEDEYIGEYFADFEGIFQVVRRKSDPYKITYLIKSIEGFSIAKSCSIAYINGGWPHVKHLPNYEKNLKIKKELDTLLK